MTEYIERDALLSAAKGYDWIAGLKTVMKRIPAADVRPVVKAHWIHVPSDGKFRDTCVCSACKKSPPIESWVVQGFNACPYCFADMR